MQDVEIEVDTITTLHDELGRRLVLLDPFAVVEEARHSLIDSFATAEDIHPAVAAARIIER